MTGPFALAYISVPLPHLFPVRLVWRKPTRGEWKRARRAGEDHYARGGLAREWVP